MEIKRSSIFLTTSWTLIGQAASGGDAEAGLAHAMEMYCRARSWVTKLFIVFLTIGLLFIVALVILERL